MTTSALAYGRARAGTLQALRAEWVKLRTVRSTYWSLLLLAGVSILFTALLTGGSDTQGGSPGHGGDNDIVSRLEEVAGSVDGAFGCARAA